MTLSSKPVKIVLSIMLLIGLSIGSVNALKTNKMARKHYVMGDKYYEQRRMNEAVNEWKAAIELDTTLEKKLSAKIDRAKYYMKHGKLMEDRYEQAAEVSEHELTIKKKSKRSVEQIRAEILQIERVGGRVAKIIIGAGSQHNLRSGYDGFISEPNGSPVGVFKIKVVEQEKCLAEVTSLSRDISDAAIAIINRPKK